MCSEHLVDLILCKTNRVPGEFEPLDFQPVAVKLPDGRSAEIRSLRQPISAGASSGLRCCAAYIATIT